MTTETVQRFYAILAILALVVVASLVLIRLLAIVSSRARGWYRAIAVAIEPNAVGMALIVATLATVGSLYFSEVAHFDPCRLCWFQRIAMYPLVVILGLATIRRDREVGFYVRVLAMIGAVISSYHLALEWIPALDTGACGTGPSCTLIWFREFGVVSLPMLALAAFLLIATLLSVRGPAAGDDGRADDAIVDRRPA
jgi:hypothetical protein